MTLSASTIAVFILLMPGLVFRLAVYHRAIVQRPYWGTNAIAAAVLVLLFSVCIHVLAAAIAWLLDAMVQLWFSIKFLPSIFVGEGEIFFRWGYERPNTLLAFIVRAPWIVALYSLLTFALAWLLGYNLARKLLPSLESGRRILYGPLAELSRGSDLLLMYAHVLTKIQHKDVRVMYRGFVSELSLGEGNDIKHIILANAEKYNFILSANQSRTTSTLARPISASAQSLLCVDGGEIENIHFERPDMTVS